MSGNDARDFRKYMTVRQRLDAAERRIDLLQAEVEELKEMMTRKGTRRMDDTIFSLQRQIYWLKQRETQRQIDEYLEHFVPLKERNKQQKK